MEDGKTNDLRHVSIKMPVDLYEEICRAAKANHRSVSGQIAFFCAREVRLGATEDFAPEFEVGR